MVNVSSKVVLSNGNKFRLQNEFMHGLFRTEEEIGVEKDRVPFLLRHYCLQSARKYQILIYLALSFCNIADINKIGGFTRHTPQSCHPKITTSSTPPSNGFLRHWCVENSKLSKVVWFRLPFSFVIKELV